MATDEMATVGLILSFVSLNITNVTKTFLLFIFCVSGACSVVFAVFGCQYQCS